MPTIYIDAESGSDSPAGANDAARLATIQSPSGALRTFVRLAQIANGVGGRCLDGFDIVVSGVVRPNWNAPDFGYALFNCVTTGVPSDIRQWVPSDGVTPSGKYTQWGLRGDAVCVPTVAWTQTSNYWQTTLPSGLTDAKVNGVLIYPDCGGGADGSMACALEKAASLAAVDSTPNSWFVDASRVLRIRFTDAAGNTVITGSAQQIDGNGTDVGITLSPNGSTGGSSANALLCFQNVDRAMRIRQFVAKNAGRSLNGCYLISTEAGNNVSVEPLAVDGGGHHFIGFTGVGACRNNTLSGMVGGRYFGATNSGFNCLSVYGNDVSNCRIADCTINYGPMLKPDGRPVTEVAAQASGFLGCDGSVSGGIKDIQIDRCQFTPATNVPPVGSPVQNGGWSVVNTADISGNPGNPADYPVRFYDCIFGPTITSAMSHAGGATAVSNLAVSRSLMLATGGGQGNSSGSGVCLRHTYSTAWSGGIPANMPRNLLLDRTLIITKSGDSRPGFNVNVVSIGNDAGGASMGATALRLRNCVWIDLSGSPRSHTKWLFGLLNATTNSVIDVQDCVFINAYTNVNSAQGSRRLLRNDNNIVNTANMTFARNTYVGFTHFSNNTSFDSQAEWSASIDTAGTYANHFSLTDESIMGRIEAILGTDWLGGSQNIRKIVGAAILGAPTPVPTIQAPRMDSVRGRIRAYGG